MKADEILKRNADVFIEKGKQYGHGYKRFSDVMSALFPEGIKMAAAVDFNFYGMFFMIVHKVMRIANAKATAESMMDSLKDLSVYAAMLEEYLQEQRNENPRYVCAGNEKNNSRA